MTRPNAPGTRGPGPPEAPLSGIRVVVTRAAHQAEPTVAAFADAGAHVERLPLLELVAPADPAPLERALRSLGSFGWIAFTSANAVEAVLSAPGGASGLGSATGPRLASIGGATSRALRDRGLEPALEAEESRAEGLATAFVELVGPSEMRELRVLLPQAADARPALEETLRAAGADVTRVDAYAKRVPPEARGRAVALFGTSRFGWVTFTSPSIARAFAGLWSDDWEVRRRGLFAASIGPVTTSALRELGVEPAAEAAAPGDGELVAAVVSAVADRRLGRS